MFNNIKDLNHKLTEFLDDKDLISLMIVNKYYYNVFDEAYWKRRLLKNFSEFLPEKYNIYEESWKSFYLIVSKWLNATPYFSIYFAIEKDRLDLLQVIYKKHKTSHGLIRCGVLCMSPAKLAVEKDSLNCFKYICENLTVYSVYLYLNKAIENHSHKIVEHLKGYTTEHQILKLFQMECPKCYEILKENFHLYERQTIQLLYENNFTVNKLLNEHNKIFEAFAKQIPYKRLIYYKHEAMERNNYNIAKCLTKYTTILK